ncbi:uncharacterized protein LTR77_006498 [Saxophila tyrrhenica]|uniref:Rhodopsin domain-containing protein n=1 Tax=Saxophila tyrrhenica TaxID=1690608 RepID=A0AAV9PB32_9PEZI|nr:hypothetical protein LTR77_006498 [Saxophila tyrrhenica]
MTWLCSVNLIKIAIVLLYLRLFPSSMMTWFRPACYAIIGICVAYTIGGLASLIFACNPLSGVWQRWDQEIEVHCIDSDVQLVAMAALNIPLDLVVFFLPIPKIIQLQTSRSKKFGVCLNFLVGLFATAISGVRVQQLHAYATSTGQRPSVVPLAIWSHAEANVGVICACMPSFGRLIRKVWEGTATGVSEIRTEQSSRRHTSGRSESIGELYTFPSDRKILDSRSRSEEGEWMEEFDPAGQSSHSPIADNHSV